MNSFEVYISMLHLYIGFNSSWTSLIYDKYEVRVGLMSSSTITEADVIFHAKQESRFQFVISSLFGVVSFSVPMQYTSLTRRHCVSIALKKKEHHELHALRKSDKHCGRA